MRDLFEQIYNTLRNKEKPRIIAVIGFLGAGKTTFAQKLKQFLEEKKQTISIFQQDWFFVYDRQQRLSIINSSQSVEEKKKTYKIDFEKIKNTLLKIKQGQSITLKNLFNQKTGQKDITQKISPVSFIIYEGLSIYQPEIYELFDEIIFLQASKEKRIQNLTQRDSHYRNLNEKFELVDSLTGPPPLIQNITVVKNE